MKKVISLLLVIFTVCTLTFGMSGCGGASKSDVVGVWKFVGEGNQANAYFYLDHLYLYVYKDGTGDDYGKPYSMVDKEPCHVNAFTWEINSEYFVCDDGTKYTLDGNFLYDKQGKKKYEKVSNDTSVDIEITIN